MNPARIISGARVIGGSALVVLGGEPAPWDPGDDFHVFGCCWSEKEIKWYVDGRLVKTRPNEYWHQPLDLTLSLGVREPLKDAPSATRFPTVFQVDYGRVWQAVNANER